MPRATVSNCFIVLDPSRSTKVRGVTTTTIEVGVGWPQRVWNRQDLVAVKIFPVVGQRRRPCHSQMTLWPLSAYHSILQYLVPTTATFKADSISIACVSFLQPSQNITIARICPIIAYFDCHVMSLLKSDWRALYSARRHGPYTHLTRPLLAFCTRGGWLQD